MAGSPNPVLVTAAVIEKEGRVLIARRLTASHGAGGWEFPGGKIEPGETPEECLVREIREELDVEIQVVDVFEVVFYRYEWGAVLILAYRCQLLTQNIQNIGVAEHRWVRPEKLVNFSILPADQPIIDRLNGHS